VRGGRLLSELDGLSDTDSDGESWGVQPPPAEGWAVLHPASWDAMHTHPLDVFAGRNLINKQEPRRAEHTDQIEQRQNKEAVL
jgi:hypothetical protein